MWGGGHPVGLETPAKSYVHWLPDQQPITEAAATPDHSCVQQKTNRGKEKQQVTLSADEKTTPTPLYTGSDPTPKGLIVVGGVEGNTW